MGICAGICKGEGKAGELGARLHSGQRQHWKTGKAGVQREETEDGLNPCSFGDRLGLVK